MSAEPLIIWASGSIEHTDPGIVVVGDPDGFDTVTGHYLFPNKTPEQLQTDYPIGSLTPTLPGFTKTGTMVCFGSSDIKALPGTYCTAAITFRGLLNTDGLRAIQVDETSSIREKNYDSLSGAPNAPANSKVRLLEQQGGLSVREITFTQPERPSTTPSTTGPTKFGNLTKPTQYSISGVPKIYCYPNGWVCYNWQSKQVLPGIWFVTSDWKYEADFTYA